MAYANWSPIPQAKRKADPLTIFPGACPIILANLIPGRQSRGLSSYLNPFGMSSGFGSIISMLNGGRGFSGTGNMFNRVFGL